MADAPVDDTTSGAAPASKRRRTSQRPDFTTDVRYAKLAPLFGVEAVAELNDAQRFQQRDFARMGCLLKEKSTGLKSNYGALRSWPEAIDMCLQYSDLGGAAEEAEAATGEAHPGADVVASPTEEQAEEEQIDEAMAVIEALLCGQDLTDFPDLNESKLSELQALLARRCDAYENSLRERFEEFKSGTQTVAEVLDVMQVICIMHG